MQYQINFHCSFYFKVVATRKFKILSIYVEQRCPMPNIFRLMICLGSSLVWNFPPYPVSLANVTPHFSNTSSVFSHASFPKDRARMP